MSKSYCLITLMQGLCIGLFIVLFKDYVDDDSFINFLLLLIPLNGLLITNRLIVKEEIKDE